GGAVLDDEERGRLPTHVGPLGLHRHDGLRIDLLHVVSLARGHAGGDEEEAQSQQRPNAHGTTRIWISGADTTTRPARQAISRARGSGAPAPEPGPGPPADPVLVPAPPPGRRPADIPYLAGREAGRPRSEEHTSELQSRENLVC